MSVACYARRVKALALVTLLLLAAVVFTIELNQRTFAEYSRDFGSLSPERFRALNARMDRLAEAARVAYAALSLADFALIIAAARRRAYVVLGLSLALGVGLGLFLLIALASVGPAMIG
jgi:lysophospholipase L1-like esterase